ncbi:hypothetical protein EV426DRAFT_686802 [Tirmania nivea]|nr:hypothetical protein EV426DRAFT_686802 [Tirmania nivea]
MLSCSPWTQRKNKSHAIRVGPLPVVDYDSSSTTPPKDAGMSRRGDERGRFVGFWQLSLQWVTHPQAMPRQNGDGVDRPGEPESGVNAGTAAGKRGGSVADKEGGGYDHAVPRRTGTGRVVAPDGNAGGASTQRVEVQALLKGMDAINTQEWGLGLTQVLPSHNPGSLPSRSVSTPLVTAGPEPARLITMVPAVPVMPRSPEGEESFSVSTVDPEDTPSFVRRFREDWESASSRRTPETLASEVVRDFAGKLGTAKTGTAERKVSVGQGAAQCKRGGAGERKRGSSVDSKPTLDDPTAPGTMGMHDVKRWPMEATSAYSSDIPSNAPESARRPKVTPTTTSREGRDVDAPKWAKDLEVGKSGGKGQGGDEGYENKKESEARAAAVVVRTFGIIYGQMMGWAKEYENRTGQVSTPAAPKGSDPKPGVVYSQKMPVTNKAGRKRLELSGNGRKEQPEISEAWVEVLDVNRPPLGRDSGWKAQLVHNFNAFAEQKGIKAKELRVEYDGRYPRERRILLAPQEGFSTATVVPGFSGAQREKAYDRVRASCQESNLSLAAKMPNWLTEGKEEPYQGRNLTLRFTINGQVRDVAPEVVRNGEVVRRAYEYQRKVDMAWYQGVLGYAIAKAMPSRWKAQQYYPRSRITEIPRDAGAAGFLDTGRQSIPPVEDIHTPEERKTKESRHNPPLTAPASFSHHSGSSQICSHFRPFPSATRGPSCPSCERYFQLGQWWEHCWITKEEKKCSNAKMPEDTPPSAHSWENPDWEPHA